MSWSILNVDARDMPLKDKSVQCVVTSPPYWGLRDYGTATWIGGDEGCDHKQGRNGSGRADGIVDERGQRNRDGVGSMGGDCAKCGAARIDSQIGLEKTPQEYVDKIVAVFREVKRVLRDDGVCFVNLGDSYASGGIGRRDTSGDYAERRAEQFGSGRGNGNGPRYYEQRSIVSGLKPKDLVGIPWRVAFALQADCWYLRSAIVLAKKNPMPESTKDRPTSSYEMMFMLTKSSKYYYDQVGANEAGESINAPYLHDVQSNQADQSILSGQRAKTVGVQGLREGEDLRDTQTESKQVSFTNGQIPSESEGYFETSGIESAAGTDKSIQGLRQDLGEDERQSIKPVALSEMGENRKGQGSSRQEKSKSPSDETNSEYFNSGRVEDDSSESGQQLFLLSQAEAADDGSCNTDQQRRAPHKTEYRGSMSPMQQPKAQQDTRNIRNVWWFATSPFPESHFATFSPEIVIPCIKAGTSEKGCCAKCGKARERVTETTRTKDPTRHTGRAAVGCDDRQDGDWPRMISESKTLGFQPACACNADSVPCIVLDPFSGAGTTTLVADKLGRRGVGLELKQDYCRMAEKRCYDDAPLLAGI